MGGALGRGLCLAVLAVMALCAPASAFEWRGVVEGPYGRPWSHDERVRMLRWMPAHGFSAYVHAPKDDLYQRTHWREPYPSSQMAEFEREVRLARELGVEWIPNLSPALPLIPTPAAPETAPSPPLCFSCPADLAAVARKLEPFRRGGSRTFMISFDDVVKALADPRDLTAYGAGEEAFGKANGDFLSRLAGALGPGTRLLTVGADYSGTQDTDYLRGLRSTLRPGIGVMWTGPSVPSRDFRAADAAAYGRLIGRKPIVWENWTNDDTTGNAARTGPFRIFLGPYRRRPEVAAELDGIFFNPANEADTNMLPLATAGDWMRDPEGYESRASWLGAVAALAPDRGVREALRAFAETSYSTKLDPTEAPTFVARSEAFLEAYRRGGLWPIPRRELGRELSLVERAAAALRGLPNRAFYAGVERFFEPAAVSAGAGAAGAELLAAERPTLEARRASAGFRGRAEGPDTGRAAILRGRFQVERARAETSLPLTYGWRGGIGFDVPPYEAPPNVMGEFLDRVSELDAEWAPRSGEASSSVAVELDGRPVPVAPDGSFRLPPSACGGLLSARDGAGGETALRLPACG